MNTLSIALLLVLCLLAPTLVLSQQAHALIQCHLTNCKVEQNLKLYYLSKQPGAQPFLMDSTGITGTRDEEVINLHLKLPLDEHESRYVLSIQPLGMDIDVVVANRDTAVTMAFTLPAPQTDAIYTTLVQFSGSPTAAAFAQMNHVYWTESIAAGKRYQARLLSSASCADSLQLNWYKQLLDRALVLVDTTNCLACGSFSLTKIVGTMKRTNTYFGVKLFSSQQLRARLERFRGRFLPLKTTKSLLESLENDLASIDW